MAEALLHSTSSSVSNKTRWCECIGACYLRHILWHWFWLEQIGHCGGSYSNRSRSACGAVLQKYLFSGKKTCMFNLKLHVNDLFGYNVHRCVVILPYPFLGCTTDNTRISFQVCIFDCTTSMSCSCNEPVWLNSATLIK